MKKLYAILLILFLLTACNSEKDETTYAIKIGNLDQVSVDNPNIQINFSLDGNPCSVNNKGEGVCNNIESTTHSYSLKFIEKESQNIIGQLQGEITIVKNQHNNFDLVAEKTEHYDPFVINKPPIDIQMIAPENISLTAVSDTELMNVELGEPEIMGIDVSQITISNDAPVDGFPLGTTTVTWQFYLNEKQYKDTQLVTINPPEISIQITITAPSDITITAENEGLISVDLGTPVISGAEISDGELKNDAPTEGFAIGTHEVTWQFEINDQTYQATQFVTIQAPEIRLIAPPDIVKQVADDVTITTVDLGNATISGLDITDITITNNAPVDGFPLGRTVITYEMQYKNKIYSDTQQVTIITKVINLDLFGNSGLASCVENYNVTLVSELTTLACTGQISSILGIEQLTELVELQLSANVGNKFSDISPLHTLTNLETLRLVGGRISDISVLRELNSLTELDLSTNLIVDTTPLSSLTALKTLNLRRNPFTELSLTGLNALETLKLNNNELESLSLNKLPALTSVDLSKPQYSSYSKKNSLTNVSLTELPALTTIDLSNNNMVDVPSLAELTALTKLRLASNQIDDLIPLSNLTALNYLSLSSNQIKDITALNSLTNLTELYISDNPITEVSLTGFDSLQKLGLSNNNLDTVNISDLPALTDLYITGSQIDNLFLTNLSQLTGLHIKEAQISSLSLEGLGALTSLDLSSSQNINYPLLNDLMIELPALTSLDLSYNQIDDLTPLSSFTSLTYLDLNSNKIADLTPLSNLTSLTNLDLGYNQISDTTPLTSLTALTNLDLYRNPIIDVSPLVGLTQLTDLYLSPPPPDTILSCDSIKILDQAIDKGNGKSSGAIRWGSCNAYEPVLTEITNDLNAEIALPWASTLTEQVHQFKLTNFNITKDYTLAVYDMDNNVDLLVYSANDFSLSNLINCGSRSTGIKGINSEYCQIKPNTQETEIFIELKDSSNNNSSFTFNVIQTLPPLEILLNGTWHLACEIVTDIPGVSSSREIIQFKSEKYEQHVLLYEDETCITELASYTVSSKVGFLAPIETDSGEIAYPIIYDVETITIVDDSALFSTDPLPFELGDIRYDLIQINDSGDTLYWGDLSTGDAMSLDTRPTAIDLTRVYNRE